MSDLDDLFDDDGHGNSDLVKQLRAALKAKNKEAQEFKAELDKLARTSRERSLADVLRDKELDPKVAKLYPADAEPTAEAVDAWLSEFGDVFGVSNPAASVGEDVQAAARQIANASASAPRQQSSFDPASIIEEMRAAKNPEALANALGKLRGVQPR